MDAERKFVDICALAAEVEDSDFGIRDTTVKARFGIWLDRCPCQPTKV